jgi:hypothetical protein
MSTKEKVERDETRCDVVKESRPLEKTTLSDRRKGRAR